MPFENRIAKLRHAKEQRLAQVGTIACRYLEQYRLLGRRLDLKQLPFSAGEEAILGTLGAAATGVGCTRAEKAVTTGEGSKSEAVSATN